jgi:uncharacterized damage-inducible protein DinB
MEGIWTTGELIDALRKGPTVLTAVLAGVDEDLAHVRPAEGEWSIVEVVGHLADVELRALVRIALIQDEDNPELTGYDVDGMVRERGYQSQSLAEVMELFLPLRATRVATLEALTAEQWLRTGEVPGRGATPLTAITVHLCWHDTNHIAQIVNILHMTEQRFSGVRDRACPLLHCQAAY